MRKLESGRRRLLRLLAASAAFGWSAERTAAQPRAKRAPPSAGEPTVVIDPGHGGIDPGAIGPNGAREKDVVLQAAWAFARRLAALRRYRVVLTRSIDEFIALRERVARARAWHADLFLSIHADALPDAELRGMSVFTLSAQASDREAAELAAAENKADLVGGINVAEQSREVGAVLIDLARRQTGNLSIAFARNIVEQLAHEVVLRDHPRRSADFAVLTAPDVPSVLVELGCLSNPREAHILQQHAYQQILARGLVRAVQAYFGHPAN